MFIERTRIRSNRLVIVLLPIVVIAVGALTYVLLKESHSLAMTVMFSILPIVGGLVVLLLLISGLDVSVSSSGVRYRYIPFTGSRQIEASAITEVESIEYDPVSEYGGWGLRKSRQREGRRAVTVRGTRGVLISQSDDSQLLIGSDKPEELAAAIQQIIAKPVQSQSG